MNAMPTDYRVAMLQDQRRIILTTLLHAVDQTAMVSALREALRELRHQVSADGARGLLAWLDETGLVTVIGEAVPVARLTERGADVARGEAVCPGVAREPR